MRPRIQERKQGVDIPVMGGISAEGHDDFVEKNRVLDLVNYRALGAVNERILPPRLYTSDVLDEAGDPRPIIGFVPFEDFGGAAYVFAVTTRRIFSFNVAARTWPAPYSGGDLTSIYNEGTISSFGAGQAQIAGAGVDGDGTAGLNLWPIKVGDILRYSGVNYEITAAVGSNPCTLTTNPAFPGAVAGQPYEIRRLLTASATDTITHCFFNQNGTARVIITDGGGAGAMSGAALAYDPILYWDATLASFQPLPGTNDLLDLTNSGGMTAQIVLSYKNMVLAMNLRERTLNLGVFGPWVEAPQRIRNSDVGDCEQWNRPGGVGYASWVDRVETPGAIKSATQWKDLIVVAKTDQTEVMAFTGAAQAVFQLETLIQNDGTAYRHAFAPVRQDLIMLAARNIYLLAGGIPYKIDDPIADELFNQIDDTAEGKVAVLNCKRRQEVWFFIRTRGFGTIYPGADLAYIYNYAYKTWSKVEVSGESPVRGITAACVVPYMEGGIPWDSLNEITWDDLSAAGTTWDDLRQEILETPLMGTSAGETVNWEGGDVTMPGGVLIPLTAIRARDGYLVTAVTDLGSSDYLKRLQELEICFEQRTGEAEFQVLSSMRKTSLSQMEQTTGWLAEGTPVDITARYFAFRIRDTNAEDVTPSELAQLRARYYLRGHR